MTDPTPEFEHLCGGMSHDLREAVTLSKGWLQAVLKNWQSLDEHEREIMVSAALFGANRVAFLLDIMDGEKEENATPAPERTALDLLQISDVVLADSEVSPSL